MAIDIAGTGYKPGIIGGSLVTGQPEITASGVFDWFDRGVSSLGNAFGTYLQLTGTGENQYAPERQVEYYQVPRDIQGPVVNQQGFALSWQLVAFGALAFIALTQMKS